MQFQRCNFSNRGKCDKQHLNEEFLYVIRYDELKQQIQEIVSNDFSGSLTDLWCTWSNFYSVPHCNSYLQLVPISSYFTTHASVNVE